jgi:TIR domain
MVSGLMASDKAVWLDEKDLVGGDLWWTEILKQIRACDVFVFAVSASSLKSAPCNAELDYARALGRPILPVKIGNVPEAELRNHEVFSGHMVDYRRQNIEAFAKLIRGINKLEKESHLPPDPLPPEPETPYEHVPDSRDVLRERYRPKQSRPDEYVPDPGKVIHRRADITGADLGTRIFLCHSETDDTAVRSVVADLEAFGRKVWLDENDLISGESWWPEVLKQIRNCDVFVFAVSANSLASDLCNAEFDYARALDRPILPVEIGDVREAERRNHEVFLGQYVDHRYPNNATAIALIRALSEREGTNRPLPDPLPPEPTTPYGYLLELSGVIRGRAGVSPTDQASIFRQLSEALRRERGASARASVISLLKSLRARDDLTERTAKDIDSILVWDEARDHA